MSLLESDEKSKDQFRGKPSLLSLFQTLNQAKQPEGKTENF